MRTSFFESVLGRLAPVGLLGAAVSVLALMGDQPSNKGVPRKGLPEDWSHRRMVFSASGPIQRLIKAQSDPRFELHWLARKLALARELPPGNAWGLFKPPKNDKNNRPGSIRRDWNVTTGAGAIAPGVFPAKYTFDVNAAPSCANDFVVMGINAAGQNAVFATAQGSFSSNPSAGLTLTIGGVVYTATTNPLALPPNFFIGGTTEATTLNLSLAINAYASSQVTSAVGPSTTITVTAKKGGASGNAIAVSSSNSGVFSWAGASLSGGVDGQANLIGWNNLYSGAGSGICSSYEAATVKWAFNVGGSPVKTSVVLSLDGTKVAFVESSTPPKFHVLTLGSGTGQYRDAVSPDIPVTGTDKTVSFGSAGTDSLSSPYVDYGADVAYIGADDGYLYKFTGVFNGTPALV